MSDECQQNTNEAYAKEAAENANEGFKHEMGKVEKHVMEELRHFFSSMAGRFSLDPFTALAIVGQTFGEYAALMDHLLKVEPERFDAYYDLEKLKPQLRERDMLKTIQLNLEDAYNNFKPRVKGVDFTEAEREKLKSMGLGELLGFLDSLGGKK
jgi:hypothetical protein